MSGRATPEAGRRVEKIEWGIRTRDPQTGRKSVEERPSESDARRVLAARNEHMLPYWRGVEPEIVSRIVVTHTTNWTPAPDASAGHGHRQVS